MTNRARLLGHPAHPMLIDVRPGIGVDERAGVDAPGSFEVP